MCLPRVSLAAPTTLPRYMGHGLRRNKGCDGEERRNTLEDSLGRSWKGHSSQEGGSCAAVNAAGLGGKRVPVLPELTSLDGFRRMSPTPPPFLSPWFRTVTMHMSSVSQARSHWSASASRAQAGK